MLQAEDEWSKGGGLDGSLHGDALRIAGRFQGQPCQLSTWRVTLWCVATDSNFDADVARAKAIYDQFGPWIDRYHGGLPAGWVASIIHHESGGNFGAPGDPSLGEVGFMQVAAYVPPLFGYDASARSDPESNIAIGVLEYELEAVYWYLAFPDAILGTDDSWKLARLAFAVGRAGSHQLAQLAQAFLGGLTTGDVYHDIVKWTQASGGIPLGSQSAAKVAARVMDIDRQWAIGQAVSAGLSGPPVLIPDPPAGPYTVPDDALPYFAEPLSGTLLIALGAAIFGYLLLTR